jgi:hypothetical protein
MTLKKPRAHPGKPYCTIHGQIVSALQVKSQISRTKVWLNISIVFIYRNLVFTSFVARITGFPVFRRFITTQSLAPARDSA